VVSVIILGGVEIVCRKNKRGVRLGWVEDGNNFGEGGCYDWDKFDKLKRL